MLYVIAESPIYMTQGARFVANKNDCESPVIDFAGFLADSAHMTLIRTRLPLDITVNNLLAVFKWHLARGFLARKRNEGVRFRTWFSAGMPRSASPLFVQVTVCNDVSASTRRECTNAL